MLGLSRLMRLAASRDRQSRSLLALACVGVRAPRPRMCTRVASARGKSACVAGRCQLDKATVKPSRCDSARARLVVRPVDLAYCGAAGPAARRSSAAVRARGTDGDALLCASRSLSRRAPPSSRRTSCSAARARSTTILHRFPYMPPGSSKPGKGRSISWALQPRCEVTAPSTTVEPSGRPRCGWMSAISFDNGARHDANDHGIAIVAENETRPERRLLFTRFA